MEPSTSLEAYNAVQAASKPVRHPRCLVCNLPREIAQQVVSGKRNRITYRVIGEWLEKMGYPNATRGRLENHFQENHKREDDE